MTDTPTQDDPTPLTDALGEATQRIEQLIISALGTCHPAVDDWAVIRFALKELSAARRELAEAQGELATIKEPRLAALNLHKNCLEMGIQGGAAQILAMSFVELFKEHGGKNYVELQFDTPASEGLGPLVVTIQRVQGLRPSARVAQLEGELEAERAKNAAVIAEATGYRDRVTELEKEVANLRDGSELWDALIGCARIRVLGTAGLGKCGEIACEDNYVHVGLELWTIYPSASTDDYSRAAMISFAQAARALRTMKGTP